MDIPTVTSTELATCLRLAFINNENTIVTGAPGGGKTAVIKDVIHDLEKSHGFGPAVIVHLCCSDPVDVKGMPVIEENEVTGEKEPDFKSFGDMRRMMYCDKPTVVFLDDFGTAPITVQTGYMQIVHERRLNDFAISDHIRFCIATNRASAKSGANQGVIETIKGRATILPTRPDVAVWCNYVQKHGVADYSDMPYDACPPELLAFARFVNSKSEPLFECKADKNVESQSCTPRILSRMGRWINRFEEDGIPMDKIPLALIHGTVGSVVGVKLAGFVKTVSKLPSFDDILKDPKGTRVPTEPNECYALVGFLASKADQSNFDEIVDYALRLSPEFRMLFHQDVVTQHEALMEVAKYDDLLPSTKDVILP